MPWRRKWHAIPPIPVFLPGKFHGQRSLVGCSPWGCKELDMAEGQHAHKRQKEPADSPCRACNTVSRAGSWALPPRAGDRNILSAPAPFIPASSSTPHLSEVHILFISFLHLWGNFTQAIIPAARDEFLDSQDKILFLVHKFLLGSF